MGFDVIGDIHGQGGQAGSTLEQAGLCQEGQWMAPAARGEDDLPGAT